jgi:hypothetical protein
MRKAYSAGKRLEFLCSALKLAWSDRWNHKNTVGIASVLAGIWTDHFLNESRMLPLHQTAHLSYSVMPAYTYFTQPTRDRITIQYADGYHTVPYARHNTVSTCYIASTIKTIIFYCSILLLHVTCFKRHWRAVWHAIVLEVFLKTWNFFKKFLKRSHYMFWPKWQSSSVKILLPQNKNFN